MEKNQNKDLANLRINKQRSNSQQLTAFLHISDIPKQSSIIWTVYLQPPAFNLEKCTWEIAIDEAIVW